MTKVFCFLRVLIPILLALAFSSVANADATDGLAERSVKLESEVLAFHQSYPARSIDSVTKAELAIADGEKLQTNIQSMSVESESVCYDRFLVNACIDDVRHFRRKLQDLVRRVTFEAKAYLRQQRGLKIPRETATPVAQD